MSVKTFDLSTLQLSAGIHTIRVKARATGYRDSNFSNSVSYVVSPQGFDLIVGQNYFQTGQTFLGTGVALEYSLDNGVTWQIFEKEFYTSGETVLSNITQIKFRLNASCMTHIMDYYEIHSTKLGLNLIIEYGEQGYIYSDNFILTQNIDDLFGVDYVD